MEQAGAGQAIAPATTPPESGGTDEASSNPEPDNSTTPWAWISLILALGWLATTAGLLWYSKRKPSVPRAVNSDSQSAGDASLFRQLCTAADRGLPSTLQLLPRWVGSHYQRSDVHSAVEAAQVTGDGELVDEIQRLQNYLYSGETFSWDGRALVAAIRRVKADKGQPAGTTDRHLPPFYPEGFHGA